MDIAEPVKSVKSRKRKVDETMLATTEAPAETSVKTPKPRKKTKTAPTPALPTPPATPATPATSETPAPTPKKRKLKAVKVSEVKEVKEVEVKEEKEKVKEPKPKRVRVKKDPAVAPQWFNKYVESVQKERQQLSETKVPAKQLKIESQEVAKKRWEDGLTRDRVHDEMNNHMGRMYKMIFSGR